MPKTEVQYQYCRICHGDGTVTNNSDPANPFDETCPRCNGAKSTSYGYVITLSPTKAEMLAKFTALQADIDLLKQGVQAIWDKVK